MNLSVNSFFDEDGLIASVKPDFSPREGQPELSSLILKSMRAGKHVVADAPTGFGKSFSVLVPAIIEAIENNKRIVVSTETLTLQDQYLEKDLVLLAKALEPLGIKLSFAAAKGRNNYICKTKLNDEHTVSATSLTKWANMQSVPMSGDIASADIEFEVSEWRQIGADEDCEKKGCAYYQDGADPGGDTECFVYAARKNMLQAQIVVTNHTLFLLDAELEVGTLLGPYDYAIIDEAHGLPEKAQDCWGNQFTNQTLTRALQSCEKTLKRVGLANFFSRADYETAKLYQDAVFEPMREVKDTVEFDKLRAGVQERVKEALKDSVGFMKSINVRMKAEMRADDSPRDLVIETCIERLRKIVGNMNTVTGDNIDPEHKDNWLSFVSVSWNVKRRDYNRSINLKPITVAPLINSRILSKVSSVTLLSATMKIDNNFSFIRSEFGLSRESSTEFTGESPFDYFEQVRMYLPKELPDAKQEDYISALGAEIVKLIKRTEGKALVLFTSIKSMEAVYADVKDSVPYHCYLQGQAPRGTLIDMFSENVHSCLFATRSFFTGIDIPGEALSMVILTKAPFRVPSDPMFKAKCAKIEEAGGNSFGQLSLPLMLFDVKQAFGRLIRTTTDKGIFALLDSRALKSSYAHKIRNTLPEARTLKL